MQPEITSLLKAGLDLAITTPGDWEVTLLKCDDGTYKAILDDVHPVTGGDMCGCVVAATPLAALWALAEQDGPCPEDADTVLTALAGYLAELAGELVAV